jgi:tRNA G18 (ribose-2'-O)-methylase SpoU
LQVGIWQRRENKSICKTMHADTVRGYFGIGAERISKPMNLGNLVRSANAFGASFVFLIDAQCDRRAAKSDTSNAEVALPVYDVSETRQLKLPRGCQLVGIELVNDAIELPSFRHPMQAAYVFGPERGSLSPELLTRCDHVVRIPTRFCINLAVAGAIVMYDRMVCLGRFAERPVRAGRPNSAPYGLP